MKATRVEIKWRRTLPIFASERFLKAVGDDYGWLGGIGNDGTIRSVLPYTIVKKGPFKVVRFRAQTILLDEGLGVTEEREFLNSAVDYFRSARTDLIIPATVNSVFRTFPEGAAAAPYGTHTVDLTQAEETLWRNIGRITRQNIKTAQKDGVIVRGVTEGLELAHRLIFETFKRSKLPFMGFHAFRQFVGGLGENGKVLVAEHQGVAHSYVVFAFSDVCAYAVYAGNLPRQHQGANKQLYWEAMRLFKGLGVKKFDFMGARIRPEKGSKQEAINLFKERFGAQLEQGYIWKYPLRPLGSLIYSMAVRIFRGGDIVDREKWKLNAPADPPDEQESAGADRQAVQERRSLANRTSA